MHPLNRFSYGSPLRWVPLMGLLAAACATPGPYTWVRDLPLAASLPEPVLQSRDTISVVVAGQPTLGGEFVVRDDGGIVAPLVGNVAIAGLTTQNAAAMLASAWKKMVVEPMVTVVIAKPAPARVNIVGEVKSPGVFELVRDRSVLGALAAAGWLTDFAKDDGIYVIRRTKSGPRVRFKLLDIKTAEASTAVFRLNDGDSVVVE